MKARRLVVRPVVAAILAMGVAACGGARKQPISELQRKEAAHLVSEAEFALTLRDWPRAEGLLAKATQLAPDTGSYWVSLGSTRVRAGNRADAKQAYEAALKAFEAEAEADKQDPDPWLRQAYVLALLGRVDDARARVDQAAKKLPDNRAIRAFIETKQLDKMIAQPDFKQRAL